MSKELRAVVLGLFVVVIVATAFAYWRRPAPEFSRVHDFKVEVREKDGNATRHFTVRAPSNLVARVAKFGNLENLQDEARSQWGKGEVSPRDILRAADEAEPGKPGVIKHDESTIEVTPDGAQLQIDVKDDWGDETHVRVPRSLIEGFAGDRRLSTSEILRRLDELGPGDAVVIKQKESEVTITAEPRRHRGIHIS